MLRLSRALARPAIAIASLLVILAAGVPSHGAVTREDVERAIRDGLRYLKQEQKADGSWEDVSAQAKTGTTSLVTLALLTAGEKADSPSIRKALSHLRRFGPQDLRSTYAIALQTMVFAAAEPERDQLRIAANVSWLESAQIKPGQRGPPGCWTYTEIPQGGDNSNTQYALLGLNAASEVGIPVKPEVWALARYYWEKAQRRDGGWGYHFGDPISTSSMTCAGVSSLVITGSKRFQGAEYLQGALIHNCGQGAARPNLQSAVDWLAGNFSVSQNFPMGPQWKHYYLYGLERAGRLAGIRFFGQHDWYRLGAEELVRIQDRLSGFWRGVTEQPVVATSFALLFLAKGRTPVLINKLRHGPRGDWNHDPDDVRNLVAVVSRDWKNFLTSQVVDPAVASVADLLQAPIVFLNGHKVPEFDAIAKQNLRDYVEHGGFVLADACCSNPDFDKGFRSLMKEIFPKDEHELRPLPDDHPIWKVKHRLDPRVYSLLGIKLGSRTAVIYSSADLSCNWNQAERSPTNAAVIHATRVGQNIVDYATTRTMPPDKLSATEDYVPISDAAWTKIIANTPSGSDEATDKSLGKESSEHGVLHGSKSESGIAFGTGVSEKAKSETEFFGARSNGHSFTYVIECSSSMASRNSLDVAKRQLLASLDQLPPDAQFSVIFYNMRAQVFTDPGGQPGMMAATAANKARIQSQFQTVTPDGGTDHMLALRTALGLKPDVVFFLTDADLMTNNDVNKILAMAGSSRIQAIEFGRGSAPGPATQLRRLATSTNGTYHYIDVTTFPRPISGN